MRTRMQCGRIDTPAIWLFGSGARKRTLSAQGRFGSWLLLLRTTPDSSYLRPAELE
jgi:hypothetical protein